MYVVTLSNSSKLGRVKSSERRLLEIEIQLTSPADSRKIERSIDLAIADVGLTITLRSSLRKFPGCVHWHLKRRQEAGTLEITFWPQERRAWFTIQSGRKAHWIAQQIKLLSDSIHRHIGER